jgi:phosphoglucosamine mutase
VGKLFGTDGIRGVAGEPPLDAKTIYAIGRALGEWLRGAKSRSLSRRSSAMAFLSRDRDDNPPCVLLGEDTRESSPWVASFLAGGLESTGAEILSAGVLPTPGVAQLVPAKGFAAGAVVSASHNPYRDNGIKLLAAMGTKFPDPVEAELERRIGMLGREDLQVKACAPPADLDLAEDYLTLLRGAMGPAPNLSGMHLVVDCAHGAAVRVAPDFLRALGAQVTAISIAPDGRNINADCGALYPEALQRKVAEVRADVGVAFDGDADRAIFVSRSGRVVNGDGVLLACARWMKQKGQLRSGCVVGTVMANLGLEVALRQEGLRLVRTAVGDRYVLEEMRRRGANLGGEQSGHVIFLDHAPTGDGLLTTLKLLRILREQSTTLDALVADLRVFPQKLRNVRVREKVSLEKLPGVQKAIAEAETGLGERGRVVVRYSGTEPLLRVMVEAESEAEVERWTREIVAAVEQAVGR